MEWISVENGLPDKEKDVSRLAKDYLVYLPNAAKYNTIMLMPFYGWDLHGGWKFDGVTHWMPLPEPPKETEGNPLIEMHLSVDPGMADSIEETE